MLALQELQSDACLFQIVNNNVQVISTGLGVEVSQEGNVAALKLLSSKNKSEFH